MASVTAGIPDLAVRSYGPRFAASDPDRGLNLAVTLDEQALLDPRLGQAIDRELKHEASSAGARLRHYMLADPYADLLLGPPVRQAFGLGDQSVVIAGAGVDSLLHALAPLARPAGAIAIGPVYPDFPRWARLIGAECRPGSFDDACNQQSSLVLAERPSWGSAELDLAAIERLCAALAERGTILLVDESYANYAPRGYSAGTLVETLPNLIVLRGFSKAYWLAGLRIGFCMASRKLAPLLESCVPPLLASPLSLAIARSVTELGDVAGGLRERIAERRDQVIALLHGKGFPPPSQCSRLLPALVWHEQAAAVHRELDGCAIIAKMQPFWGADGKARPSCRMSLPLSAGRMHLFRQLIGRKRGPA